MQIRPASVRLVQLNFGLSMYLDRIFRLSLSLSLSLSRNFGLRPKFRLSERLSKITSLFDLSLVSDRTLAQRKAQRKAKSKSEVAHWAMLWRHSLLDQWQYIASQTMSFVCTSSPLVSSHFFFGPPRFRLVWEQICQYCVFCYSAIIHVQSMPLLSSFFDDKIRFSSVVCTNNNV